MTVTLMEEKQRGWIKQLKDKRRRGEMNERKGKKTVRVQFVQHICRFQILRL